MPRSVSAGGRIRVASIGKDINRSEGREYKNAEIRDNSCVVRELQDKRYLLIMTEGVANHGSRQWYIHNYIGL